MSTHAETIEAILGEDPKTRIQIAEETGLEVSIVSPTMTFLRNQGRAQRTPEGWIAGDGAAPPKVRRHVAEESATVVAAKKRKKAAKGRKPRPGIRLGVEVEQVLEERKKERRPNGRTLEFARAEDGAILVRKRDPHADWGEFTRADADALVALLTKAAA